MIVFVYVTVCWVLFCCYLASVGDLPWRAVSALGLWKLLSVDLPLWPRSFSCVLRWSVDLVAVQLVIIFRALFCMFLGYYVFE